MAARRLLSFELLRSVGQRHPDFAAGVDRAVLDLEVDFLGEGLEDTPGVLRRERRGLEVVDSVSPRERDGLFCRDLSSDYQTSRPNPAYSRPEQPADFRFL